MLDEVGRFITTVGFPVAVASFLLWRLNGKMDRLTNAIYSLLKHQLKERRRANDLDEDEHGILQDLENGRMR